MAFIFENEKEKYGGFNSQNPLAILSMAEVAERIFLKDSEAAKRWCRANGICVHKFIKKDYVYQFDLQYVLAKPFVMALLQKHPENWKSILQDVLKWDALYNYFLLNFNEDVTRVTLKDITPADEQQEKLLKRLLQ